MINRQITDSIRQRLNKGKVIILVGARQVGKTTLTNQLIADYPAEQVFSITGDDFETQRLTKMPASEIEALIEPYTCILLDEAHKVNRIGDIVKALVDKYGDQKQIILTGSSTIGLVDKTSEPLTGRKRVFELYPLSTNELELYGEALRSRLPELLTYGLYPEVVNACDEIDKRDAILELARSSLYRDVLDVTGARASGDLVALLRFLAQSIGETLSINEISLKLSIDRRTIDRYIDLLAKSFIVFPLMPYSRSDSSLRRSYKVYFWDVGVRNAILEDFTPLEERSDTQALFQNFVIAERMKNAHYRGDLTHYHFWRSYDGAEVDLVEIRNQAVHGLKLSYDGRYMRESKLFDKLEPTSYNEVTPDNLQF
ncbi:ATP-binding protein [Candidatus Saccharibacteria bacterium]|nr:ATP-binding protein [Candidatus Saccharibacteria bacterium]MCB9821139.1 ATP-binding protein [Candidatus Nomurabacteria bacterium]